MTEPQADRLILLLAEVLRELQLIRGQLYEDALERAGMKGRQ